MAPDNWFNFYPVWKEDRVSRPGETSSTVVFGGKPLTLE